GVKLTASAPSIHMVQANILTEVTPFVGTEQQGEELARYFAEEFEKEPARLWNSEFLGRSLQDLIRDGIESKLHRIPEHAQHKLQETLTRIVNEGSGGLICIIL
ncbi:MAG TPA: sporulation stage IV protein A, partial [Limnochorda sp.]